VGTCCTHIDHVDAILASHIAMHIGDARFPVIIIAGHQFLAGIGGDVDGQAGGLAHLGEGRKGAKECSCHRQEKRFHGWEVIRQWGSKAAQWNHPKLPDH
jgi:hypothetical protein